MSTETGPSVGDRSATEDLDLDSIDWEHLESRRFDYSLRQLSFAGTLLLWAGLWVYDFLFVPAREPLFFQLNQVLGTSTFTYTPDNVDWLFGLTLIVMFYGLVVPMYQNRRMTAYYWTQFRKNKAAVLSLFWLAFVFLVGLVGPYVVGAPEMDWGNTYQPPVGFGGTWEHPFGTHRTGEDILQITVSGARVSMQIGLVATLFAIVLATAFGTTAAYLGGWVDEVLMRFVDLLLTFPTFFLILFLVYIYGGSMFLLIVILAFTSWGGAARLIRSEALQRSEEAYIEAARSAGASKAYIIRRHIVPNVSNTVITAATLLIPFLILYEAIIAFLGFGDPDVWSWGRIIDDGRGDLRRGWWISTIPGMFLFLTVMAFNFVGDATRDALDPRHE